ncbi:MAG: hypothetical protein A2133_07150 [Actinobacteria bacterium RBG_16_64_13]|nr:MAG: hypothetical protein A2133_07150 [Actinobacteria bacterium RBG_16_64_13]
MKKMVFFLLAVVCLVLALSSVALAATPQEIYNDYASDGSLDGTYTDAELQAYLDDAWLDQYGDPAILTALDAIVNGILSGHEEFPFTGAEVALMGLAVLALVGGGMGLRRLTRSRA